MVSAAFLLGASAEARADITSWAPQLVTGCAQSIAADSNGYVYIGEFGRVKRYTSQGLEATNIGSGSASQVLGLAAVPGGGVNVLSSGRTVSRYDAQGALVTTLTLGASGAGAVPNPAAIASDPQGNLYIADTALETVKKFDPAGSFERSFGSPGTGPGQLDFTTGTKVGVSVDGAGNLYVTDDQDRIQKFAANGTFLGQWGSNGDGDSQFQELGSIAADSTGRVYAGDRAVTGKLKRFSSTGDYQGVSEPTRIVGVASATETVAFALTCQGVYRIELSTPSVRVVLPTRPVIGQPAKIVAQASVPFGQVVEYEFDLDGNGSFEQSGTSPEATVTFDSAALRNVTVRATSQLGGKASASLTIRPVPPGQVGISLNEGNYATNSESVEVETVWPDGATAVTLSNDGGFGAGGGTRSLELAGSLPWKMRDMGAERITRVVYARFDGSANPTQTYSDDIVLDKIVPKLEAAELLAAGAATSAKSKRFRVRLKGSQKRSGISIAQFSSKRSGGVTVVLKSRKVRGLRRLNKSVRVVANAQPRFVRVQSAAGSWSRWKKLKR